MPTTCLPEVIDAIYTGATDALGETCLVFDGLSLTSDPGMSYLMVGVDNVDAIADSYSGDAFQKWANANGTARDENGEVVCAAVAWNGDSDQKAARDEAFRIVGAVEDMLRANPPMDVPGLLWTSFGERVALSQDQSHKGAVAVVIFRVNFRARI